MILCRETIKGNCSFYPYLLYSLNKKLNRNLAAHALSVNRWVASRTVMESRTLQSLILLIESIVFTVIVPGTVTVVLPRMILREDGVTIPETLSVVQYVAVLVIGLGIVTYFWCLWDFVVSGRGIPSPIDHPKHLVVRGLYRYVRNPMYLGVLCVLVGEVSFLQSGALFLYASTWFVIIHTVVLLYEEPTLRTKFGADYDRYARSVRRWLPGRPRDVG